MGMGILTREKVKTKRNLRSKAQPPQATLTEADFKTVLLSPWKPNTVLFQDLLRQARTDYGSEKGALEFIDWYASIFRPKNINQVIKLLQETIDALL